LSSTGNKVFEGQEARKMAFFAASASQRSWEDNMHGYWVFTRFLAYASSADIGSQSERRKDVFRYSRGKI
jgi:hypothetical protein